MKMMAPFVEIMGPFVNNYGSIGSRFLGSCVGHHTILDFCDYTFGPEFVLDTSVTIIRFRSVVNPHSCVLKKRKTPGNVGNRRGTPGSAGKRRKITENDGKRRKMTENTGKLRKTQA